MTTTIGKQVVFKAKIKSLSWVTMAILLPVSLTACSGLDLPVGPDANQAVDAGLTTNGIANQPLSETIDPADLDEVRSAMKTALFDGSSTSPVQFENTITGTTGEIVPGSAKTLDGKDCRTFATTMNSIDGIQIYDGDACRDTAGAWELLKLTPRDKSLGG